MQFVRDYFNAIKTEHYDEAWAYLSPAFQDRQRNGYDGYVAWWREANQGGLVVNTIQSRFIGNDSSEVDVSFQYQGKRKEVRISLRLTLVKAGGRNDWWIDRALLHKSDEG